MTTPWNNATAQESIGSFSFPFHDRIYNLQESARNFTRLEKLDCLELYVDPLNSTSDVVLVAKNLTSAQNNGSSLIQGWINGLSSWDYASFWVCGGIRISPYCTRDLALSMVNDWTIATWEAPHHQQVEIDHCLVGGQADNNERCGFYFSSPAIGAVSIFTLVGYILIFFIGRTQADKPLVTLSDTISTFLEAP